MENQFELFKWLTVVMALVPFIGKGFEYFLKTDIEKKIESKSSKFFRKATIEILIFLSVIVWTTRLPLVIPDYISHTWITIVLLALYLFLMFMLILSGVDELRESLRKPIIIKIQELAKSNENKVLLAVILIAFLAYFKLHNYMITIGSKALEIEYGSYSELIEQILKLNNDAETIAVLVFVIIILGFQYLIFRYLISTIKENLKTRLRIEDNQIVIITLKDKTELEPYKYISQNKTQYILKSTDGVHSILLEKSEVRSMKYTRNVEESVEESI